MAAVRIEVADPDLRAWVAEAVADSGAGRARDEADLCITDQDDPPPFGGGSNPHVPVVRVRPDGDEAASRPEPVTPGSSLVVLLPSGLSALVQVLRWAGAAPSGPRTEVLAVVGARGGAGATTLSAGLGAAVGREGKGSVVVVDADPAAAGIDLQAGLDEDPGIRWGDLVAIRGAVPPASLRGRLPRASDIDWLATAPGTPNAASWRPVVASLASAYDCVVLDLPRYRLTATPPPPAAACIVAATLELSSLSSARFLLESGRLGVDPLVALRAVGGPVRMATATQMLADFRLVEIPDVRSLRGAADFGDLPDAVARGPFARACRTLLAEVRA